MRYDVLGVDSFVCGEYKQETNFNFLWIYHSPGGTFDILFR